MIRMLFLAATALFPFVAAAQAGNRALPSAWVKVPGDDTLYTNPATIKAGDTVKMWVVRDFTTASKEDGKPALSMKSQMEYDCRKTRYQSLSVAYYSGRLATGEVVSSTEFDPGAWQTANAGGTSGNLWKVACRIQ